MNNVSCDAMIVSVSFIYLISFGSYHKVGKTRQPIDLKYLGRLRRYEGIFKIVAIMCVDSIDVDKMESDIIKSLTEQFQVAKGREYFKGILDDIRVVFVNHAMKSACIDMEEINNIEYICDKCDKEFTSKKSKVNHEKKCTVIKIDPEKEEKLVKEAKELARKDKENSPLFKVFVNKVKIPLINAKYVFDEFSLFDLFVLQKDCVLNIVAEFTGIISTPKQRARLTVIRDICKIFGVKNSLDTTTVFGDAQIVEFGEYFEKNKDHVHKLFPLRIRSKVMKLRSYISLMRAIFNVWSNGSVKTLQWMKKTTKSHDYVLQIEIDPTFKPFALLDSEKA